MHTMATKAERKAAAAAARAAATTTAAAPQAAPQQEQPVPTTTAAAPQAPVVVPTTNPLLAQAYSAGKPYNVRPNTAADNSATWALLQGVLKAGGGTATRAELQAAALQRNHVSFVGYAIRRGWLVPKANA